MIRLITTGGTIAEAPASGGRAHWDGGRLLAAAGELGDGGRSGVEVTDLMDVPSTFLDTDQMYEIATAVGRACADPAVTGVVVTHGTATMEETAYFTGLLVRSEKPVVFTGALLTPDLLGYDGALNLRDAIATASSASARGLGVVVVMHGEIHAAREVAKVHASAPDAFRSTEFGPLGRVGAGGVRLYRRPVVREHVPATQPLSRVEILTCYAGMDREVVRAVASLRPRGLVIQAMGSGNVPPSIVDPLREAVEAGIIVVLSTRCGEGRVERKAPGHRRVEGYTYHLEEVGVIFTDLPGVKARLKLIALLSTGADRRQIAEQMVMVP